MTADELEAIIEGVAQRLGDRLERPARFRIVSVAELAEELKVSADWVYEHASEIGVMRLGMGSGAPLRFDLDRVLELLQEGSVGRRPAVRSRRPSHV